MASGSTHILCWAIIKQDLPSLVQMEGKEGLRVNKVIFYDPP